MSSMDSSDAKPRPTFDPAEMGAIAHLYRGEVYRSTTWRTRLDNTTNWPIVTMGIALSTTFSSPEASPLPLVLVGLLLAVFLGMEARRYRYFNVWRARARWLEMNFYAPIFTGEARDDSWQVILARDYTAPRHHISFVRAAGQDSHPSDACGDPGRIFRSRRRRTDSRLDRSDDRLCLLFRLAGVRARHDVAPPAPAPDQRGRGGGGVGGG